MTKKRKIISLILDNLILLITIIFISSLIASLLNKNTETISYHILIKSLSKKETWLVVLLLGIILFPIINLYILYIINYSKENKIKKSYFLKNKGIKEISNRYNFQEKIFQEGFLINTNLSNKTFNFNTIAKENMLVFEEKNNYINNIVIPNLQILAKSKNKPNIIVVSKDINIYKKTSLSLERNGYNCGLISEIDSNSINLFNILNYNYRLIYSSKDNENKEEKLNEYNKLIDLILNLVLDNKQKDFEGKKYMLKDLISYFIYDFNKNKKLFDNNLTFKKLAKTFQNITIEELDKYRLLQWKERFKTGNFKISNHNLTTKHLKDIKFNELEYDDITDFKFVKEKMCIFINLRGNENNLLKIILHYLKHSKSNTYIFFDNDSTMNNLDLVNHYKNIYSMYNIRSINDLISLNNQNINNLLNRCKVKLLTKINDKQTRYYFESLISNSISDELQERKAINLDQNKNYCLYKNKVGIVEFVNSFYFQKNKIFQYGELLISKDKKETKAIDIKLINYLRENNLTLKEYLEKNIVITKEEIDKKTKEKIDKLLE